jgi:hypothetical protein
MDTDFFGRRRGIAGKLSRVSFPTIKAPYRYKYIIDVQCHGSIKPL